jgi:hypothetical protein
VAIALSFAFGFGGGASSTQRSAKDQNLAGTIASSKRMADGKEWTTANLNVNTSSSYLLRRCGTELPSIWPFVYVGVGAARMSVARRWMAAADRRRMASDGEALWWSGERFT